MPTNAATQPQTRAVLSISVMGGLTLFAEDAPVPLANRKARAILAYLALNGAPAVSRERLAGLFWGESSDVHARNSLRQTLSEINTALQARGCGVLGPGRGDVFLRAESFTLDLNQMLDSLAAGEMPKALREVQAGAELLLAGYEDLSGDFRDWVMVTRRATQDRLLHALERGYEGAALPATHRRGCAEAALRLDPLHEAACRALMRLAAEAGEIGVALRAYAALYETLGAELDMEPSEATQQLVAQIKQGRLDAPRQGAPSPASAAPTAPTASAAMRLAPGGVPVVAVLPLLSVGNDPALDWMAEAIMEDVVRALAGLREPVVISSNSTRHLRAAEVDLQQTGARLGAQYLVSGSVRMGPGRARISVELADAAHGAVLWGDAYDVGAEAMFDTQQRIAASIATILAPQVNAAELRRSMGRRPEHLDAYHLLLRARDQLFRLERPGFNEAGRLLREAVARDAGYAAAHAALADWHSLRIFQGWSEDPASDVQALMQAAWTAIRLDPFHARALALLGHNLTLAEHRHDEAAALLDRAVAAAPNDAEVLMWSSPTYGYVGRTREAIASAERALLLTPQDPFLFRYEHFVSLAYYTAGEFEPAAAFGLRSWHGNPNYTSNLRMTIAALAALGRIEEARPLVERLMMLQPGLRASSIIVRNTYREPEQRAQLAGRLIAAGVPR